MQTPLFPQVKDFRETICLRIAETIRLYVPTTGALASAWSPSFSINISDVTISLGAEIGSVGSIVSSSPMGTSVTVAAGVGFSVGVSFDEGKKSTKSVERQEDFQIIIKTQLYQEVFDMTIKQQKVLLFMPIINMIIVFKWIGAVLKNPSDFSTLIKTIFKMFGCIFVVAMLGTLILNNADNYVVIEIATYVMAYLCFLSMAYIALRAQIKLENNREK